MKARIWHNYNHDDATVNEVDFPPESYLRAIVDNIRKDGGILINGAFIPWHRINQIGDFKRG